MRVRSHPRGERREGLRPGFTGHEVMEERQRVGEEALKLDVDLEHNRLRFLRYQHRRGWEGRNTIGINTSKGC